MRPKIFIRPALAIVLGFLGAVIARLVTPPEIFAISGTYFLIIAVLAFGTLGFILPDILEFAGRAGIAALALQLTGYLTPVRRKVRQDKSVKYPNPMVVDTSALIDGRLADVVKTGFAMGTFLIIPSVVSELHKLSDSADSQKRARGRRGLDILKELQTARAVKVVLVNDDPEGASVDEKLLELGKQIKGKVVTVDFNLNKVAKVRGVSILNLNELANAVKTVVLPYEVLTLQVSTVGKEKDQGVGYLNDGTMVVVEGGAGLVGEEVKVKVQRVLQTVAGKMIFGKISN